MMKNSDVINVYWAPQITHIDNNYENEMLYPNPTNLFSDLMKDRVFQSTKGSFFTCPSVTKKFKNTFVFKNALTSHYVFDENNINATTNASLSYSQVRDPSLVYGPQILFGLSYIFFADQDLDASFSSPTFSKPGYTQYGSIFPGEMNIGSWFRPYIFEVQMWNQSGEFKIEEDEPIFYVNFNTDKKINIHRFKLNTQLQTYMRNCVQSPQSMGANIPLVSRYKKFKDAKMNNAVLLEIKNNIIGVGVDE